MRIDKNPLPPVTAEPETRAQQPVGAATAVEPAVVVGPGVAATHRSRVEAEADTEQRLKAIKALVDSGEYKPDLDQLAERLVDEELGIAGRPK
jgi:anti-sigma28 factor (negative regulator of flagellin synthesis)